MPQYRYERPFRPIGPPGPANPSRPGVPQPYAPGQEIRRRDFHAPTVNRPGGRPGFNPASVRDSQVPESRDDLWRMFIATDLSS
ncbi:MAG: hypothetical protein VB815_03690, partial [Dehalococcoidia bacterium]